MLQHELEQSYGSVSWREMTLDDRLLACSWFGKHYGGRFPEDFLPATGVTVCINGMPVCIIPVYLEQTSLVAVPGHVMVDDDATIKQKYIAVKTALKKVITFSTQHKKRYIVTMFGRKSVNRIARNLGFTDADKVDELFYYTGV